MACCPVNTVNNEYPSDEALLPPVSFFKAASHGFFFSAVLDQYNITLLNPVSYLSPSSTAFEVQHASQTIDLKIMPQPNGGIHNDFLFVFCAIPSRKVVITFVNILIAVNCTLEQELDEVIACCMFILLLS